MEGFRRIAAPLVMRSLVPGAFVAGLLALMGHAKVALALVSGAVIGIGYLYHIAAGYDRLAVRLKAQLPFTLFESVLRVLIAGAAPVLIVGRGPLVGYLAYFVGFVAPLAVATFTIRNEMRVGDGAVSR